ncbi:hypothetical protein BT93_L3817 [Corymbia citriodora subsp. variegata]|uniref:DEAD-box ATP-dependent RNA helicase 33 n=1 Tax=Corymbia citriodora subsp. variegata TaxID=360336 RepID=A0A8T0CXP7_CORYI|nr:hypothetical protein BT93_L3817 [Corymbia citriodora subsp. variegata]
MSTLQMSLLVPTPPRTLSFSRTLAAPIAQLSLLRDEFSHLSLRHIPRTTTVIRMGGGPRTFPGGVSKWQWKRMQKKKAKQLLKARLCRERHIYEMRKRAELKAAVSELERPWEAVEKAPRLFSVSADDQLKALADRFQRPGGFDMWTNRDGPQVFAGAEAELPSARFFPKGVVHSVKPYGRISDGKDDESDGSSGNSGGGEAIAQRNGGYRGRKSRRARRRGTFGKEGYSGSESVDSDGENMSFQGSVERSGVVAVKNEKEVGVGSRKGGDRRRDHGGSNGKDYRRVRTDQKKRGEGYSSRALGSRIGEIIEGMKKPRDSDSEVYDMSLQQDGSYRL